jgi:hypothetical protein
MQEAGAPTPAFLMESLLPGRRAQSPFEHSRMKHHAGPAAVEKRLLLSPE